MSEEASSTSPRVFRVSPLPTLRLYSGRSRGRSSVRARLGDGMGT